MKTKTVTYQGKFLGLNFIKGASWRKGKNESDKLKYIFRDLIIKSNLPKMKYIEVEVDFWSRHDVDNLAYMVKFFIDTLVSLGKLPNDTKQYFGFVSYRPKKELGMNVMEFKVNYLN